MIKQERIRKLNRRDVNKQGRYVLYWMQQSQRTIGNHALEYAAAKADELQVPLVVWFGLTTSFPDANLRHYHFMLQGLQDVAAELTESGIRFIVEAAEPGTGAAAAGREAAVVVTDAGYLRVQRRWREEAAEELPCPLIEVETDVIVPVETASEKEEYAAATIRKKIHRKLNEFILPMERRVTANGKRITIPSNGKPVGIDTLDDKGLIRLLEDNGVDAAGVFEL